LWQDINGVALIGGNVGQHRSNGGVNRNGYGLRHTARGFVRHTADLMAF